jgi:hypothetical protein
MSTMLLDDLPVNRTLRVIERHDLGSLPESTEIKITTPDQHTIKIKITNPVHQSDSQFWGMRVIASTDSRFKCGQVGTSSRFIETGDLYFFSTHMIEVVGITVLEP